MRSWRALAYGLVVVSCAVALGCDGTDNKSDDKELPEGACLSDDDCAEGEVCGIDKSNEGYQINDGMNESCVEPDRFCGSLPSLGDYCCSDEDCRAEHVCAHLGEDAGLSYITYCMLPVGAPCGAKDVILDAEQVDMVCEGDSYCLPTGDGGFACMVGAAEGQRCAVKGQECADGLSCVTVDDEPICQDLGGHPEE